MEIPLIAKLIFSAQKIAGLAVSIFLSVILLTLLYSPFSAIVNNINKLSLPNKKSETGLLQETYQHTFVDFLSSSPAKMLQDVQVNQNKSNGKPVIVMDTTPPVISESFVVRVLSSGRTVISWSTNEPGTSLVEYGTNTNYEKSSLLDSKTVKDHSVELNGLNAGTKYHFRMLSKDSAGNLATSKDYTFDTQATPPPSGGGNAGGRNIPTPPSVPPSAPTPPVSRVEPGVTKKVMVLIFDPVIESSNSGSKKLTQLKGWNDPSNLDQTYISDIRTSSEGYVNYQIAVRLEVDGIPVKADGFKYGDQTYLDCLSNSSACHNPDGVDYLKILSDYDVCSKRNSGELDELWIWGGPYFGYYESILTGPNAFWYNAPPLGGSSCNKQLPIMGFNYERGVSEMIENLGHRTESVMRQVYGSWNSDLTHSWNRFTALDKDQAGKAGCGNIHFGPNSTSDYDWSNTRTVSSNCEDWLNYPNLTGTIEQFNCSKWGCDGYGYKKWWFAHVPRYGGETDGKWNNWWRYILDYEGSVN